MAFNPSEVAHRLRSAMKGFGTNDQELISAITSCTNAQLQEVRQWYSKEISRDLLEDIKSETSGEYEQALTGLILLPEEYDAKCLNKAMKGLGTDEDVFVQHLCHRTTQEIQNIDAAYLAMFGKKLAYDIESDFSGEGLKVAIGLVKYNRENPKVVIPAEVDAWVDVLYNAGEGKMGTDEDTFVEAICSSGPTWLKAVNEAYGRKHGHTLVGAVEKEFSGFAAKALEAMVQEHDEYYAKLIRKATEGAGSNEDMLTRVIVSRRSNLKNINTRFMDEYNVTIAYVIESEVGSDIGKLLKSAVEGA